MPCVTVLYTVRTPVLCNAINTCLLYRPKTPGIIYIRALYISEFNSSSTPGVFVHVSITTPIVSALKNYYR